MVAVPVAGDVERPAPDEHRARRHHLVEHHGARTVGPVGAGIDAVAVGEPGVEPIAVDAESVVGSVVGAGDEAVERHRHVEDEVAHLHEPFVVARSMRSVRWTVTVSPALLADGRAQCGAHRQLVPCRRRAP